MSKTDELNSARERMIESMKQAGRSPAWINGALSAFDRYRSDRDKQTLQKNIPRN